ncbi:DNA recombination protein RmuC [Salinimicrobium catena]|uniref:DNA recombination protein RmuC n=1 Tax=Salinimicrobium catena TaxID=390640 RepID=A0A1H5P5S5_9FLAO|nr:DNA recombination protein RmuC [Salinimicrobium catena]SDL67483.1 DNA recombination protein RmuC [Salinimicrobium catena]SEF08318.1 DNA recombination protein RmuC [Salinimicrobium catena]
MNEITLIGISLFILLFGAVLGFIIAGFRSKGNLSVLQERNNQLQLQYENYREEVRKTQETADRQYAEVCGERENIREEKDLFRNQLTQRNSELENLREKLEEQKAEVEKLQEKFSREFENLANKILDQKSEKFTSLNKENIQNILSPLQEKIKTFEEKVEKNSNDFIERHAQLGKHLQMLSEQNIRISEEANNLTKALKGENKTQGNWGELILERVLEKSGLMKDREYFVQRAHETEEGKKLLPDVVLHLPADKRMVIDSKVSLVAYEKYINEEDEAQRGKFLKEHLRSLNNHILDLSSKKYEDLYKIQSPDFVLMFIPVEPALYLAQNADNSFFYTAFQKNILLVSPTTLLSVLRTIDTLWSNEKQQQNAMEIANHAASLYHKFKILLDDLETVGNRLNSTSTAYEAAMKKLTGQQNLIKDIDKLEALGISPKQRISQKWIDRAENEEEPQNRLN